MAVTNTRKHIIPLDNGTLKVIHGTSVDHVPNMDEWYAKNGGNYTPAHNTQKGSRK